MSGSDPTDFIATMDELVLRLGDKGETVSDEVYLDIVLKAVTASDEFRFIRDMHYRDSFAGVEHLKRKAVSDFIDVQSRKSSASGVSDHGAAMTVASSNDQRHQCQAYGHFKRDCPALVKKSRSKPGKKKAKKRGGIDPSPRWCSYHETNTHRDAECHKQKEIRGLAAHLALLAPSDRAHFANIGSAHLAQLPQPDPTTFGFVLLQRDGRFLSREAAASSPVSAPPPTEFAGKPAASAPSPSETPAQDHR